MILLTSFATLAASTAFALTLNASFSILTASFFSASSRSVALAISRRTRSGEETTWEESFFSSAAPSWMAREMVALRSWEEREERETEKVGVVR